MALIDTYLNDIRTAVYGREVRSAIVGGILECYHNLEQHGTELVSDALINYATKADLSNYLTSDQIANTYVTLLTASSFLTKSEANELYVLKTDADNFVTKEYANTIYATKEDLVDDYLTKEEAGFTYAQLDSLTDYVLKSDLQNDYMSAEDMHLEFATKGDVANMVESSTLENYLTKLEANETYALQSEFVRNYSFDYMVCQNRSSDIPSGIIHKDGAVGVLAPSAETMHKIYLVKTQDSTEAEHDVYDEYITIELGNDTYAWEKIGGAGSSQTNSGENPEDLIDLTNYVTYTAGDERYVKYADLDGFITQATADERYATPAYVLEVLSGAADGEGLVMRSDLRSYITYDDADDIYATKNSLLSYLKATEAEAIFATKSYIDTMIITAPTGDNPLIMLEIDAVPGTSQEIIYDSNGRISQIKHNNTASIGWTRIDEYAFTTDSETNHEIIVETRRLSSGQVLTITTDTETLDVTTTYVASGN